MDPVNMAAKEKNDMELQKMEEALARGESLPESETPAAPAPATETPAAAPSADGEIKQPASETPAPAAQPDGGKPAEQEELTEEEVQKLSSKAQKRFKTLADQNIRIQKENEFLKKHMKKADEPAPAPIAAPAPIKLPWDTGEGDPLPTEDPAVVARREAALVYAEERRQETILSNLQTDAAELETQYPEFNPKDPSYDPSLVTKISVWFKAQIKENNDLRLKDFVTELMSLRAKGIDEGRSQVTETVIKQAAQQALVPTAPGGSATDSVVSKIQQAKTIEELEALESQL